MIFVFALVFLVPLFLGMLVSILLGPFPLGLLVLFCLLAVCVAITTAVFSAKAVLRHFLSAFASEKVLAFFAASHPSGLC